MLVRQSNYAGICSERRLTDILGCGMRNLFGTADARDLECLAKVCDELHAYKAKAVYPVISLHYTILAQHLESKGIVSIYMDYTDFGVPWHYLHTKVEFMSNILTAVCFTFSKLLLLFPVCYSHKYKSNKPHFFLSVYLIHDGDRGSKVVKVLCYKSEGCWYDPSWYQCIFH